MVTSHDEVCDYLKSCITSKVRDFLKSLHRKWSFPLTHFKCQCCPHIETNQLICTANQLTGFYMRTELALNGLKISSVNVPKSAENWRNPQCKTLFYVQCILLTSIWGIIRSSHTEISKEKAGQKILKVSQKNTSGEV